MDTQRMQAVVQERFGPPESLRVARIDRPALQGAGTVLVRVRAASLNPYDWHVLRGDPTIARLLGTGFRRPRHPVAGIDVAGVVASAGGGLAAGTEVLGFAPGSLAEFVVAGAALLVPKPPALSFEEAAALPMAGTTALRGVRDTGRVRAGQQVLVIGAGGGVGSFAVQIARDLGAEVTAVCGPANVERVRALGAARVLDHTVDDVTAGTGRYDVVLDNVGVHPPGQLRRVLRPRGVLVLNGGGSPGHFFGAVGARLGAALIDLVVRQDLKSLPAAQDRGELLAVAAMAGAGTLTVHLDRVCSLDDTAAALAHVEAGHTRGKVVVILP